MSAETKVDRCKAHPHEETRLFCTECECPICPKCMVMYEVGFKCPDCARKRPNHVTQVHAWQYGVICIGAIVLGFVYGNVQPWLLALIPFGFFGIPILAFFLAYSMGRAAGEGLQRLIGNKLGMRLLGIAAISASIGVLFSGPIQAQVFNILGILLTPQTAGRLGSDSSLYLLGQGLQFVGPFLFIKGLCRSFHW